MVRFALEISGYRSRRAGDGAGSLPGAGRPPRRGRSRAFSLIEVVASVAIFSIAIVALIEGIAQSTRTQAWVESQARAAMLAQNIMEEIEYAGELTEKMDGGEFEQEDSRYQWVSEILESPYEGLFEVRVTIVWMEGDAQRDFQLVTYMRPRDEYEFAEPLL